MPLRFIWPGKTKSEGFRVLQEGYAERIARFVDCRIVETREAKGIPEKEAARILEMEARCLENEWSGDYIVSLADAGQEMDSMRFARFLKERVESGRPLAFVAGGFLGLAPRVLERSDLRLSLSRLTMSHELARVVLLEQVYRGLTIWKGRRYAR